MLGVKTKDPFQTDSVTDDPLPHFAPFFPDEQMRKRWMTLNAYRAQSDDLFAAPNVGFHHNPMESDVSYLYVAASPNYPGEVKIGMTGSRPDKRLKKASTDIAFRKDPDVEIKAYFMIKNARARDVEAAVHKLLEGLKSAPVMPGVGHDGTGEREWFAVDPLEAVSAVELAARTYSDPKRVSHLSDLIRSGLDDLDAILIIEDLVPGFLDKQEHVLTDPPGWKPEEAGRVSALFDQLHGISFGRLNKWKELERTDIVLVPIESPPDQYFWDYARWLIPQREELMGSNTSDLYPGAHPGFLRSLDVSTPDHQACLRNGFVVATISREGALDLRLTLGSAPIGGTDLSSGQLYRTDLVRSSLMGRITDLYWELRERLDRELPPPNSRLFGFDEQCRTEYLHRLSSLLVRTRPEELSPRTAQSLHSSAMVHAGTHVDMSVCPVELCEIARPILERSGRTAELSSDLAEVEPA